MGRLLFLATHLLAANSTKGLEFQAEAEATRTSENLVVEHAKDTLFGNCLVFLGLSDGMVPVQHSVNMKVHIDGKMG